MSLTQQRILGIDPGSRRTGYGIIEQAGSRLRQLTYGTINTTSQDHLVAKLKQIYVQLGAVLEEHQPDSVAIEQVFVAHNPTSALKLGHARGVAMLAGCLQDLPVYEYSALQVKQAVVGHGKADKKQVQHMVRCLLNCPALPQEDAADALAVALCHAHTGDFKRKTANL